MEDFEAIYRRYLMEVYRYLLKVSGSFDVAEEVPLDQMIRKEDSENVKRILHGLPEPYREVFLLRVTGEMSFKNIGKIFGKSESWSRVTFFRARKMIAERMGGDGHESL